MVAIIAIIAIVAGGGSPLKTDTTGSLNAANTGNQADSLGNTGTTGSGSSATSPLTTTVAGGDISGMGATVANFQAAHGLDGGSGDGVCSTANPCFGSELSNTESGATFQFTDVLNRAGLITGYAQNFVPNTSLASVEQEVMQWMPADATASAMFVASHRGTCALYNITSPTLGVIYATQPSIGDPHGVIGVELSSTNSNANPTYDPNNIQKASISIAPVSSSTAC